MAREAGSSQGADCSCRGRFTRSERRFVLSDPAAVIFRVNPAMIRVARRQTSRHSPRAKMVGVVGFEPTTSCSQSTCAATALHPDGFVLTKRMCLATTSRSLAYSAPAPRDIADGRCGDRVAWLRMLRERPVAFDPGRMSPTGARSDAHLRTGSPLRVVPAATGRVQTP